MSYSTRAFDGGKIIVKFATEDAAKSFDEYLDSELKIVVNGEVIGSTRIRDDFNPYEFFNVKKEARNDQEDEQL